MNALIVKGKMKIKFNTHDNCQATPHNTTQWMWNILSL